jgi:putative Mg2+ transporter-C (MgtC) family protein
MQFDVQVIALGEILLAMVLGGAIGFERELAGKPAGLRTHMLVAGAAALFVALGNIVVATFLKSLPSDAIRSDPIRIIQAIIVGISFLGAGTIFRSPEEEHVVGLTTSAAVLFTAGIGIAVGLAQIFLAVIGTILLLVIVRLLGWAERRFID